MIAPARSANIPGMGKPPRRDTAPDRIVVDVSAGAADELRLLPLEDADDDTTHVGPLPAPPTVETVRPPERGPRERATPLPPRRPRR